MKIIPIALLNRITRSGTKLAHCVRIERRDGNVYGFITNTKPLTIGGVIYRPVHSFNPTDITSANSLETDNLTIDGFIDDIFTEDDVRVGRWDYAAFRVFDIDWSAPTLGDVKMRAGHFGQCTLHRNTFTAELLGLTEAYGNSIGDITQPKCRNTFGDAKCGVPLSGSPTRVVTGTIVTSSGFISLGDPARAEPAGHFDEGRLILHFDSGDLEYEVKTYVPGSWTTKTPYGYDAAGVAYTMYEGCSKTLLDDCVARFSNGQRFNGEPWLRGNDALTQIGRHK